MEADLLVIGYGSTLRSDDGVGPHVADAISELKLPGVRTLTCDLLAPEVAEQVSRVKGVVFVDASVDTPVAAGAQLRELAPAESSQIIAHSAAPQTVLAVARDVFNHAPKGWLLTIPAVNFEFGEKFSPEAIAGADQAIRRIRELASELERGRSYPPCC